MLTIAHTNMYFAPFYCLTSPLIKSKIFKNILVVATYGAKMKKTSVTVGAILKEEADLTWSDLETPLMQSM